MGDCGVVVAFALNNDYMVAVEKKEKKKLKGKEKRRGDVVRGRFVHAV